MDVSETDDLNRHQSSDSFVKGGELGVEVNPLPPRVVVRIPPWAVTQNTNMAHQSGIMLFACEWFLRWFLRYRLNQPEVNAESKIRISSIKFQI